MTTGPLPVIAVTAQGRPQVSVAAMGRPVVASVTVQGQQGPPGPPGIQGPAGDPGDYGDASFAATDGAPMDLPVGVATRFPLLVGTPSAPANLRAPFAQHAFFHDGSFWPHSAADSFILRVKIVFNSGVSAGHVRADLLINGSGGQADSSDRNLILPAQTDEVVPFPFNFFARSTFLANGASLWLTPSVPLSARLMTIWVKPLGSA